MTTDLLFPLIGELVKERGFVLQTWSDRYSDGVWVCCLPYSPQCEAVNDVSEDGDLDMIPATEYLLNPKIDWLPVLIGSNFIDALQTLEARLNALPKDFIQPDSKWIVAVHEAIEHLRAVRKENSGDYGGTDGKYIPLPSDFTKLAI